MKTTQNTTQLIVTKNRTQNVYAITSEENFLSLFTHLGYNVKFFESLRLERQYARSWRAEQRTPIGWKFTNTRSYNQRDGWTSISKNKTYTHSQLKKKFETLYRVHLRNQKNQANLEVRNHLMAGGINFMNKQLVKLMPTKIEINQRLSSSRILSAEYRNAAGNLDIVKAQYDTTKSKWGSPRYNKLQTAYNGAQVLIDNLTTEMKKEVCLEIRNEIEDTNGTRNGYYAKDFNFSVFPHFSDENYSTNKDGTQSLTATPFEIKSKIYKWGTTPTNCNYDTYGLEGDLSYIVKIKGDARILTDKTWVLSNFSVEVKAENASRYKSGTSFDFTMAELVNASQEKYLEMLTSIQNQRDGRVNITLELTNMLIDITSQDNTKVVCGSVKTSPWSVWTK